MIYGKVLEMRWGPWRAVAAIAAVNIALFGCTSSCSAGAGRPSCTDTSLSASRLMHGCTQKGKVYKAIAMRCVDGRTLYNAPAVPPDGASGYSDRKIRAHAVTIE